jgi:CheY-like chemotaxis protein
MAKIMLVEDDNNLREIYGARLLAEGYEIVSAQDGEEALALAVKEKPDLIISDVMMPRISGFDMLDILRNAPETKNTKVIMMTALSQAEDKSRADKLGADRYLVKSQVTLEDVANVVHEVLGDSPKAEATPAPAPALAATLPNPEDVPPPAVDPAPAPEPAAPVPEPSTNATPVREEPTPEIPAAIAPTPAQSNPTETVEAIANPEIEVSEEDDNQVQAPPNASTPDELPGSPSLGGAATPPTASDSAPVSTSTSIPVIDQSDTPAPADDTAAASAPLNNSTDDSGAPPATDDSALPPVVEPADPASIKVELPAAATSSEAAETSPTETASVTPETAIQPESTEEPATEPVIGPSLAEALAAEEQSSASEAQSNQKAPTDDSTPESTESASSPAPESVVPDEKPFETVVQPTEPVVISPDPNAAPQPDTTEEPAQPPQTAPDLDALGKKVIQPINDPLATPDINALLAAEERKAAVDNPVANTVVTPGPIAKDTAAPTVSSRDDPNNIAL